MTSLRCSEKNSLRRLCFKKHPKRKKKKKKKDPKRREVRSQRAFKGITSAKTLRLEYSGMSKQTH